MTGAARPHPFLDHPGPIPFAHRGGTEAAPENSMAAFAAAVALGYRYLETDLHATADGVLVAFHDDTLDRVTDRRGRIERLPWAEVRRARLPNGDGVPSFDDLLGAWAHTRVNLDPKTDAAAALLPAALERHRALDRVCVGSFSGRRLAALRRALGPRLCTSAGPLDVARVKLEPWGLRLAARCLQVPVRRHGLAVLDGRLVDRAHRLGLPVHAWTINRADEMTRLLDLGVDGVMTDRPTVLKQVLEARGEWAARAAPVSARA